MPAPDLSVIVPPLAQARGLKPSSLNHTDQQWWYAPDGGGVGAAPSVRGGKVRIQIEAQHDSPAWPGLLELAVEIRRALGAAS